MKKRLIAMLVCGCCVAGSLVGTSNVQASTDSFKTINVQTVNSTVDELEKIIKEKDEKILELESIISKDFSDCLNEADLSVKYLLEEAVKQSGFNFKVIVAKSKVIIYIDNGDIKISNLISQYGDRQLVKEALYSEGTDWQDNLESINTTCKTVKSLLETQLGDYRDIVVQMRFGGEIALESVNGEIVYDILSN